MLFNLFRNKQPIKKEKQTAAAEGFKTLVGGLKGYAIEDAPNNVAVLLALYVVDLSVRVAVNVANALETLSSAEESPVECKSKDTSAKPTPKKQRSVRSRPVRMESMEPRSDEEDSLSSDSFTFGGQPSGKSFTFAQMPPLDSDMPKVDVSSGAKLDKPKGLATSSSLSCVPEHALLKGFVRQTSRDSRRAPFQHARHLSLDASKYPLLSVDSKPVEETKTETPPSPFLTPPQVKQQGVGRFDLDDVDRVDSLITITESETGPKIKTAHPKSQFKIESKIQNNTIEEDDESVFSSPRSVFSDSVTRFHSNFCNPQFNEEPAEMVSSMGHGGSSMRQRYTMKRLQSLMGGGSLISRSSHRSSQPPNEKGASVGLPPLTPGSTLCSFRSRSFRGKSFCSRAGDEEGGFVLSEAYRMVRLESQIRRAWKLSHDVDIGAAGNTSQRESEGKQNAILSSFRKSRNNRAKKIAFLKVPNESSKDNMLTSRKDLLLNPAFGAEEVEGEDEGEDTVVDEGTETDAASVQMRTPLRRMGSLKDDYNRCQKNLDEGAYDNPLRLCSFRSYDSDTELELTSIKVRNPISRLLSFRLNRGVTKEGISLADIDSDEVGGMTLDQVSANPIREGMLEKYLTQLVIDEALDAKMTGDACDTEEDARNWSSCQQEWVPQEMDDKLKCFLMDRFLLDNVLNEMDVNLGALEIARVSQTKKKKPSPAAQTSCRKLMRS